MWKVHFTIRRSLSKGSCVPQLEYVFPHRKMYFPYRKLRSPTRSCISQQKVDFLSDRQKDYHTGRCVSPTGSRVSRSEILFLHRKMCSTKEEVLCFPRPPPNKNMFRYRKVLSLSEKVYALHRKKGFLTGRCVYPIGRWVSATGTCFLTGTYISQRGRCAR